MGIVKRLLIPRGVRRATHPVRTARRAVTPRPIKKLSRTAFVVTNPLGAIEGAFENAVVDALRPSRGRRRSNLSATPTGRSAVAREGRYFKALDGQDILEAALNLYRLTVAPSSPPKAPAPLAVDENKARKTVRRNAHPPLFSPRERRRRLRAADELAAFEVAQERGRRAALEADQQQRLDATYVSLMANEPEAVRAAVGSALAAMPLDASVLAVEGSRVDIAVVYPLVDLVPSEAPVITPTGRPSARKRTQTERNDLYAEAIASAGLAALKVAAAAAPEIKRVRLLVIVAQGGGEPVLAADVTRNGLAIADSATARGSLGRAGDALMAFKGRTSAVAVLARQGLVDELLASVERVADAPRHADPFDRAVFAGEQEELAAKFGVRLQTLAPEPPLHEPTQPE
jgi:hypothetical protein